MARHRKRHASRSGSAFRRICTAVAAAVLCWPAAASATVARTTVRGFHFDMTASVPSRALLSALAKSRAAIPSFSRQTGLACDACHHQFPQLTPFGRLFKLNGYTMTGLKTINDGDSVRTTLKLSPIPPVAAMVVTSLTHVGTALPGTQNNSAMFPEQASLFLGGQVTPDLGAFIQFTYAAADGSFGIDNVDFRYAKHTSWMEKDLLLGLTLHNNPTVQDVWNTVPAWGYPFMSPSAAPSPAASTLIDGNLGQQVLGLGGYALWDNLIYTEFTAYRSAQQGGSVPLDSMSQNVIKGVIPYARIAVQHAFPSTYVMVGGFGLLGAHVYPTGVTGATDSYTTLGLDAQVERKVDETGGMLIGRTSFIHEKQSLDATFAAAEAQGSSSSLQTFRANVSYLPNLYVGATLGYFNTSGTTDSLRYAPALVTGSGNGSPNSNGFMGELSLNAWQNTRVSLQYTAFRRFNGGTDGYDGTSSRRASDNNTIFLYTWVVF